MADRRIWGYKIREPHDSEKDYFSKNPHVSGMAAEDGQIILNPYSKLKPEEMASVAKNEAARLFIREKNHQFDFELSPEQVASFKGTAYENSPSDLRATIIARALSGDPSAGQLNQRQQQWVDWLRPQLEGRY